MGATKLNLTQLELNRPEEIILKLMDPARPLKDLGEIKTVITLMPKTQEDKEQVCLVCILYESTHVSEHKEKSMLACEKSFLFFCRFSHQSKKNFTLPTLQHFFKCIFTRYD